MPEERERLLLEIDAGLGHQIEGEEEQLAGGVVIQHSAGDLTLLEEGDQAVDRTPQVLGDEVFRAGGENAGVLTAGDELTDESEVLPGHLNQCGVIVFLFHHAGKGDLEKVGLVDAETQIRESGLDQLLPGVIGVLGKDGREGFIEVDVPFGSDGGDEGLLVSEMGIGSRVTDPGAFGNLTQAEVVRSFFGKDFHASLDKGVL